MDDLNEMAKKYIHLIIIISGILSSQFCNAQSDSLYKTLIHQADSAYEFRWLYGTNNPSDTDRFETAKSLYVKALAIKPNAVYPSDRIKEIDRIMYDFYYRSMFQELAMKGETYLESGDFIAALAVFSNADSLYTTNFLDSRILLCKDAAQISNIDSARHFLQLTLQADSFSLAYMHGLARDHFDSTLLPLAIDNYKKALRLNPDSLYVKSSKEDAESFYQRYPYHRHDDGEVLH